MLHAPSYVDEALRGLFENKKQSRHVLRPQSKEGLLPLLSIRESTCHDKTGYAWSPEV